MPKSEPRSPLPAIDVKVEAGDWPAPARLRALAKRALAAAFARIKVRLAADSEVSFVFTDDAHVRKLNRAYRKKDKATNVLSFPGPAGPRNTFGPLLGDLVFAYGTIVREAAEEGIPLEHHLMHLIVHGLLHLLGYDHQDDREAAAMESLETAILVPLGVADPYGGEAA